MRADVLIVGAGPVGLSLAIELGHRGIACLVVEQNDRVGYNPRAKLTNVRSREHLRRWGIAENLRKASPLPRDYPSNIVFATRLNGYPLARFENAFYCAPERNELFSESAQWVPQYMLEEVLRAHAETLPSVEVRFSCRLESAAQSPGGVEAEIVDAAARRRKVRSAYLVGADGARSTVRELLGIRMEGQGAFSRNYNIIFRAPRLADMHRHGPAVHYWLVNPDVPSMMGPMDGAGLWFFFATQLRDGVDPASIDPRRLIHRATGLEFDLDIVTTDPWVAHRLIATRYGDGRIYLAGDACHLHPPFGGYGMNMGIGDAVDLGWKLAATLQGWGGPALLDSYERERRPVHERVMNEAVENHSVLGNQLVRPGIEAAGDVGDRVRKEVGEAIRAAKAREFKSLGVVLGYRYADSPIIVADGSAPPPVRVMTYEPSAHPGCLAPHLWLADGSSLYDHFGAGFSLLVTEPNASAAASGLADAAARRGVPLKVIAPAEPRLAQLYAARFALVRPDQHVAWRGNEIPPDAEALIDRVRGGQAAATARIAAPV
ncbi:MAG: FAD-dependent monooxygenase [Proteobacteria bacterium]|nr:FAD-dependent monooxygenase [Pseudomonadota bacterium]